MQWRIYHGLAQFIQSDSLDTANTPADLQALLQRVYDNSANLSDLNKRKSKRQEMLYWIAAQVTRLFTNYATYRGSCIHTPDEGVEHMGVSTL